MRQAAAMNYGMANVGMVVVAPAASFHHTHHHHHHHEAVTAAAAATGDPIFPLLSGGGPCMLDPDAAAKSASGAPAGAIQFWQPPPQSPSSVAAAGANPNPSASPFAYLKKPLQMLDAGAGSSGATTCQDCGNQAKKDCGHSRCQGRSQAFFLGQLTPLAHLLQEPWLRLLHARQEHLGPRRAPARAPAARCLCLCLLLPSHCLRDSLRRVRAQEAPPPLVADHHHLAHVHLQRHHATKLRHHIHSPRRVVQGQAPEAGARAGGVQVRARTAYQATVTINGHLFKGFLYDQGPDDGRHAATSNDDSTAGVPNISERRLAPAPAASGKAAPRWRTVAEDIIRSRWRVVKLC